MKKIDIKKCTSRREISKSLIVLNKRWEEVLLVEDSRKRSKEILKLKSEIKNNISELKKLQTAEGSANFFDNSRVNIYKETIRCLRVWLNRRK